MSAQRLTSAGEISGPYAVPSGYFANQGTASHHVITPQTKLEATNALEELGASGLASKPMEIMSASFHLEEPGRSCCCFDMSIFSQIFDTFLSYVD
jgi:hypothetical protein